MSQIASNTMWFYGGIAWMALACLLLFLRTIVFMIKKKKINKMLDEEYGQPQQYNRKKEGVS